MQLLAAGLDHHSAPLALRERIALSGERLDAALARLGARAAEGFVLSTCNRTEWYALVGHAATGADLLLGLLAEGSGLDREELAPYLTVQAHETAVRHLFRVAAGLESMVPGEDQILAQLKQALARAARAGTLGPTTHRLGSAALAAGKRVRRETGLSRHALSVVSVALQLATEHSGALAGRSILVVGAGSVAELALKHLADAGAAIMLTSRTAARGAPLAARHGARYVAWDALDDALADADLLLSGTSAPSIVIGADRIAGAMRGRADRPLAVFDLAVPRDVDPAAAMLPGVALWDIDGLQAICEDNRHRRLAEIVHAEGIVESDADRFMAWWAAREVAPTITALLARAAEVRDAELERALTRLPGLTGEEQRVLRTLAARVVSQLLHRPLTVLRNDPEGANMAQVVQELFGLALPHERVADAPASEASTGSTSPAVCRHVAR